MKRITHRILALLPLVLLLSVHAHAMVEDAAYPDAPDVYHIMEAEEGALVPKVAAYAGQFSDVSETDWFYGNVAASYEYGLFRGQSPNAFAPNANITVAELLTLSARIHAAYQGDTITDATDEAWYTPYVAYLAAEGAMDDSLADYAAVATRAQLAGIFALSLPEDAFGSPNGTLVTDAYAAGQYITDVDEYTPYQPQILWLYRQGLLNGMDSTGSYWPDKPTTRAEVAALVTRMVDPSLRLTLQWSLTPPWSVAGMTLSDLVPPPESVSQAPAYDDEAAVDALVRQMLSNGANTISLRYPKPLTQSDAQTLAEVFTARVKVYCEQMYNAVSCQRYLRSGRAELTFYAMNCLDDKGDVRTEQMDAVREQTMAKAIKVHDTLWETGALTADMNQYEIALVYYQWLCDHCEYDWKGASDEYSASHIAYSALVDGKSVCDGYTGAYNLFLKLEGIDCYALPSLEENHIWTVATLDGVSYHIDVTWGDQSGWTDLKYFAMTAAQSYAAHPW